MVSERTLYRLIDSNEMDIKNIDLPRKVRYKPRAKSKQFVVDKDYRKGRTYDDFINFISENPDINVVQMDTLEGVKGGAVLLTLHFLNTNLQLSYLRETNTARSVSDVFEYLYNTLGHDDFTTLFPVILTDMGNEFTNPKAIEFNSSGERRTRIFYCNPKCPEDKGSCEKNHVEIRKILPKGRSFNNLNQHDINLVMSHVNSYCRKKLNGKSPYLSFNFIYGESILNKLGINYIPPNDVILKPSLIKK
jgi:IS30 family transposase